MKSFIKRFNLKFIYKILTIIIFIFVAIFSFIFFRTFVYKKYLYPLKHTESITYYAKEYNLDVYTIFALIKTESNFNEKAVSNKGAIGVMQITPTTANYIASILKVKDYDLFNPASNVNFGCYYLRYLLNKFKNEETALVAYNAGEGNVLSWLNNEKYSKDGLTLFEIPFKESKEYIKKINNFKVKYKQLYPNFLTTNT